MSCGELKTGPKTQKLQVHRAAGPKNLNRIYGRSSHSRVRVQKSSAFSTVSKVLSLYL
jgi:hypothetical protein